MNKELYKIYDEYHNLIGSHLTKEAALLLIDALFTKYYNEPNLYFTIGKMDFETKAGDK